MTPLLLLLPLLRLLLLTAAPARDLIIHCAAVRPPRNQLDHGKMHDRLTSLR